MTEELDNGMYTGETLSDRYHVDRLIGRGGMGEVYLGKHLLVNRPVAVKIMRDKYAGNRPMIVRFFRSTAAAAIGHQNIIDIFDVGVTDQGDPFIIMEYLEGESLEDCLTRRGRLNLGAACGVLEPVLQALSSAHQKNIVHRDLKPANIFLTFNDSGTPIVKLIDFGVAKMPLAPESAQITQTGAMVGTPHYMAPEQIIDSEKIDFRTDLFTVGVIFYELLTGTLPYDSTRSNNMMKQIVFGEPLPPTQVFPEFPEAAEPIIMRAMERELDERYASANDMLGDLRALDAWPDRDSELAQLERNLEKRSVAVGTLGAESTDDPDPNFASEHLLHLAQRSTPRADDSSLTPKTPVGRSKTGSSSTWNSSTITISFSSLPVIAAVLGVAIMVVLGVLFLVKELKEADDSIDPSSIQAGIQLKQSQPEGSVQVNIEGLPKGAKVLFDGKPVSSNPVEVRKGLAPVPITIEAQGFEEYKSVLIPKSDIVLKVDLRPVSVPIASPVKQDPSGSMPHAKPTRAGGAETRKKKRRAKTAAEKKSALEKEDDALRKGHKGLEFIEDFK